MTHLDAHEPAGHRLLITFEGIEGVGKTTQIARAADWLRGQGRKVLQTREPGGTPTGQAIRKLLLDPERAELCPDAELLLMFADRAQHLKESILPALQAGTLVLCDRFTDATYAYQGYGRGLSLDSIARLEEHVQKGLRPGLTLWLDAPVTVGLERAGGRSKADRFEQERQDFFERVQAGYRALAEAQPQRFTRIDASADIDSVAAAIYERLQQWV